MTGDTFKTGKAWRGSLWKQKADRLERHIEFVRSGKHKDGAFVALPEAVHTRECPYWRHGQKHGPCVCGGCELQNDIDLIFGPYGQRRKVG
jgi:hypothetical protein